MASVQKFINSMESKLKNKSFVANAPEEIVEKDKLAKLQEQLQSLK
ncbi:hypothetical protein ACFL2U_04005 [Patescibacteria group bacterium]